ncbi:MAG: ankyrin repeat domain-containing protein [Trebonia sp.]
MSDPRAPSDLSEQELAFCEASIRDWHGRAARMLAANPELAGYGLATAVVLGDATRVREAIAPDPAVATRPDARTGWTPLHVACASRWHRLDPARAPGLVEVARLLLDAGADPAGRTHGPRADWTPLRCAVAGAANPDIVRLLLDRGAVPDDHDLYLACFGDDDRESLRLLLGRAPDVSETTALSAPISTGDTEAVRMLLDAGANPNQPMPADLLGTGHGTGATWPAAYAAVQFGCDAELLDLLLARDDATAAERFLSACLHRDKAGARQLITEDPGLVDRLTEDERGAIELAAERGDTEAVRLMVDLGFPLDARRGDHGSTALHAAAYSGSAETVRLLLARGADIEARDSTWDSTPLEWAKVGSGYRPQTSPDPDWAATVRILLDAGASTESFELSPDDLKPASAEVADILRAAGVRG